jgi:uncharacterized protein (TIGR02246 family)
MVPGQLHAIAYRVRLWRCLIAIPAFSFGRKHLGRYTVKQLCSVFALGLVLSSFAWAADLQSDLMKKEEMLWTAWGKKDAATFEKYLTEDAVQIGASGSDFSRESILRSMEMQSCDMRNFGAQDVAMRKLSDDVIVLNYTLTQEGECNGKKLSPRMSATSIYVQKDGRWLSTHYQESPLD